MVAGAIAYDRLFARFAALAAQREFATERAADL